MRRKNLLYKLRKKGIRCDTRSRCIEYPYGKDPRRVPQIRRLMQEYKTIINLTPPGRIHKEGFVSKGHVCGYCHGKGWFHGDLHTDETVPCPDCGGSGEVMAIVSIDWKPSNKVKNEEK